MMILAEAVSKLVEVKVDTIFGFFLFALVACLVFFFLGSLANEAEHKKDKQEKERKQKPNCLMCECGRKATHFVNVNGVDQPMCLSLIHISEPTRPY